jgi:hypothetical protein
MRETEQRTAGSRKGRRASVIAERWLAIAMRDLQQMCLAASGLAVCRLCETRAAPRREREAAEHASERERPRADFETRPVRYPAGGESKTKISKARSGSKTIWLW